MKRFFQVLALVVGTALIGLAQQPVNQGQTAKSSGSLTATAASSGSCGGTSCVTVSTVGYASATVTVHGTYTGSTINFEFSDDGGTTYYPMQCGESNAAVQESSKALGANASTAWDCGIFAATNFEVRQSAISTGTAVVNITLSAAAIEGAPTVSGSGNFNNGSINSTGSAVPSSATYIGGNGSGNLTGQIICDNNFVVNNFSTSGSTQEVAASGSTKIYVCGFSVNSASTTAVTFKLVYGTGTNCATSPADLSIAVPLQAVTSNAPVGQNVSPPSNVVWSTTASQALCVNLSAAQPVNAQVWYTRF